MPPSRVHAMLRYKPRWVPIPDRGPRSAEWPEFSLAEWRARRRAEAAALSLARRVDPGYGEVWRTQRPTVRYSVPPMKLPRAEHAVVEDAKVRDYLLSREHPVGRFKAAFFGAHFLGRYDELPGTRHCRS